MLITIIKIHPFSMRIGPWECLWCVNSGFTIEKAVGFQNDEMFIWRATDFSVGQNEAGIKYNLFSHLRSMPELIQQQIEQLKKKTLRSRRDQARINQWKISYTLIKISSKSDKIWPISWFLQPAIPMIHTFPPREGPSRSSHGGLFKVAKTERNLQIGSPWNAI